MANADLRNRTVVITGASSGIGRATAEAFARAGAKLVLAARRLDALNRVAAACRRQGAQALTVETDVTDPDAVRRLADAAISRFGAIDVWINDAGVGALGAFDDTPMAVHRKIISVNLEGVMNGAHAVLPHFRRRGRGTLINILSLGAYVPAPYATAYAASKFGARAFGAALRAELRREPAIAVCDVCPTFVDTPGFRHAANYTGRDVQSLASGMDARDVADAIVAVARRPRPVTMVGQPQAAIGRLAAGLAPELTSAIFAGMIERLLQTKAPARDTSGAILAPIRAGQHIDHPQSARRRDDRAAPGMIAAALIGLVGIALARPLAAVRS